MRRAGRYSGDALFPEFAEAGSPCLAHTHRATSRVSAFHAAASRSSYQIQAVTANEIRIMRIGGIARKTPRLKVKTDDQE